VNFVVFAIFVLVVFGSMLVEARRAWANERVQRAKGGVEPSEDIYAAIAIVYPTAFAAMILEGVVRGTPSLTVVIAGLAVFAFAKLLKWWAIATLGQNWTFRVIVVPGGPKVRSGPYRFLRHPNYVGVVGELAGVTLMTGAIVTGPIGTIVFICLLLRRIAVEERALVELEANVRGL